MRKNATLLGVFGSFAVVIWGIYLVIVTELTAPKVWYGPGIFGPYAGRVGGIILIVLGLLGLLGGAIVSRFHNLGGIILAVVCFFIALTNLVTFTSLWLIVSLILTATFFFACQAASIFNGK